MIEAISRPGPATWDSVGTRVSWGAIAAGAFVAFGLYFLLGIMGAAVGLQVSEHVNPAKLQHWAIAWTVGIIMVSLFVGGMVASQFTVGEDKIEAMLYGIIMWALLFLLLLAFSAFGVRSGFQRLVSQTGWNQAAPSWEEGARAAGVPAEQIAVWRRSQPIHDEKTAAEFAEAITRVTWYAFAGIWLSMLAAAAGALFGAHPTFRGAYDRQARVVSHG